MNTTVKKPEVALPPAEKLSRDFFKQLVIKSKRILLIAGQPIDGDSLASVAALYHTLPKLKPEQTALCDLACAEKVPAGLQFVVEGINIIQQPDFLLYDLIIILDCGELKQTGYLDQLLKVIKSPDLATVINIDHHVQTPEYGNYALINHEAASAGLIVYELIKSWRLAINQPTATALLTTLYHDTGSFQHSNTSVAALRMAAECVRAGADAADIAARLYRDKPAKVFRLWGRALQRLEFFPKNKMVASVITYKDLKELNVSPEEAKGIVSIISQVPESRFALLLTEEEPNEIKGSLRSDEGKNTDVARIARLLGGGGHKLASGFKIQGRIEKHDGRYRIV